MQECRRAGERKKRQFAVSVHFVSVVSVCFFVAQHSIKHHGITNFTYFINKICCTLRQCAYMKYIYACKKGCRWLHHQQLQMNIMFKYNEIHMKTKRSAWQYTQFLVLSLTIETSFTSISSNQFGNNNGSIIEGQT